MDITWIGTFGDWNEKGEEEEHLFRIDAILEEDHSFTGKVWEEEFYGLARTFVDVQGFIEGELISFVKTYPFYYGYDEKGKALIDKSKPGHEVAYEGKWDKDAQAWIGEWEIELETTQMLYWMDRQIFHEGPFQMKEHPGDLVGPTNKY